MAKMNCAVLGCGFVADFYLLTRRKHPEIHFVGAYDIDAERLETFSKYHGVHAYDSFESMLEDEQVDLVLNLTNPRAHFETTKACLIAGKHVYSEKPLAMNSRDASELASLAQKNGLGLATAPCSLLSETAQTLWKGVNDEVAGPVRLVYAAFDDGMVHRGRFRNWKSPSGAFWPAKDEFEIGCTYEHASYVLSWLAAIFGPAQRVQAYASTLVSDKGIEVEQMAPDFTVGCIEYDNDVVARVTCSLVAPIDKSIQIFGEKGTLYTKNVRNDSAPVYFESIAPNRYVKAASSRLSNYALQIEQFLHLPFSTSGFKIERKIPYANKPRFQYSAANKLVDFLLGPEELVHSIHEQRPCRLSAELGVHLVEILETLQYPERFGQARELSTSFSPIEPLNWATAQSCNA